MWKKLLSLTLCVSTLLLGGCGMTSNKIRFGTAALGGMYHSFGSAFTQLVSTEDIDCQMEMKTTAGSAANLRLLSDGYIELGIAQMDLTADAYKGTGIFEGKEYQGFKAIAGLYTEACQIVVRADSSIHSLNDLQGKTISIGEEDSGTERNANQILKASGLSSELVHTVNLDYAQAASQLQSGDIDAAYGMAYEAYPNFENDNYQFSSVQTSRAFFCSMNMTSPVIQDAAVRKAIAMGINKAGFVKTLLDGHGVAANGAFPDGFSSFGGEHVKAEEYDPDGAKALLEQAGWVDTDGDGIREKNGTKLTIRWLTYPSRQELPLLAEAAQASLKEIGMDVDINCTASRREFLADMTSWDVYASALVTAPSGDPQYFFTTSCVPGMSYNFGAYDNPEVTALIEELSKEFDTTKRGEIAVQLQQMILDDNAYVFCSFLQMNMISKENVRNYTAHACDYYQVTAELDIM